MSNSDFDCSGWPRQGSALGVLAMVVGIGISGMGLVTFFVVFHRDQSLALFCLRLGGLSLIGFAVFGHCTYGKQIYVLLTPPLINACLWLWTVPFTLFTFVVFSLQPLFLLFGLGFAIMVASEFVVLMKIPLGTRRIALVTIFSTIFIMFEVGTILAFPYMVGLLVDQLESYGFKLSWS